MKRLMYILSLIMFLAKPVHCEDTNVNLVVENDKKTFKSNVDVISKIKIGDKVYKIKTIPNGFIFDYDDANGKYRIVNKGEHFYLHYKGYITKITCK